VAVIEGGGIAALDSRGSAGGRAHVGLELSLLPRLLARPLGCALVKVIDELLFIQLDQCEIHQLLVVGVGSAAMSHILAMRSRCILVHV